MICPLCGAPLDFVGQDLERHLQCRKCGSHQVTLKELYELKMKRISIEEVKKAMEKRKEQIERKIWRI